MHEGPGSPLARSTELLREAAALVDERSEALRYFRSFVDHNEPELALGELAGFGATHGAPSLFWRLLADTIHMLGLTEADEYYGKSVSLVNRHAST